jgi:hypothetical protein
MGVFDQFISARLLDRYPQLYRLGQKGEFVCSIVNFINIVQHPYILGMDYKWVLSFPYRLYRVNLLFHLRRCTIGWTAFRTLGMGNNSVHCNAINCPWQSCPYHQVRSPKMTLIPAYGLNGRYLRFQGRL